MVKHQKRLESITIVRTVESLLAQLYNFEILKLVHLSLKKEIVVGQLGNWILLYIKKSNKDSFLCR